MRKDDPRKKMLFEKAICLECGAEYNRRMFTRQRWCSQECRDKKRYPKKWAFERECVYCHKKFIPVNQIQKLCSKECAFIYNSFEYKCKNGGITTWEKLRFEVFKRDNFTCQYCERNVREDKIKIHCDHIIPKSKGGEDIISNLVSSCSQCNLGKFDNLLENRMEQL